MSCDECGSIKGDEMFCPHCGKSIAPKKIVGMKKRKKIGEKTFRIYNCITLGLLVVGSYYEKPDICVKPFSEEYSMEFIDALSDETIDAHDVQCKLYAFNLDLDPSSAELLESGRAHDINPNSFIVDDDESRRFVLVASANCSDVYYPERTFQVYPEQENIIYLYPEIENIWLSVVNPNSGETIIDMTGESRVYVVVDGIIALFYNYFNDEYETPTLKMYSNDLQRDNINVTGEDPYSMGKYELHERYVFSPEIDWIEIDFVYLQGVTIIDVDSNCSISSMDVSFYDQILTSIDFPGETLE